MEQDVSAVVEQVTALVTVYGLQVIGAIAILIAGWIGAGWAARATDKGLRRIKGVDRTLARFFVSAGRYTVLVITGLAVLSQFGVQMASLLVVLSTAGLAIGLALQGTLSNVAAGVMLLFFRPFKIGDYVEVAGHAGTVGSITLFTTELSTPDNVHIIVPNAQVWGASVINYSHHETRRLEIVVGIGYGDDIDKAIATISGLIDADDRALDDPAPLVAVIELGDSAVNLMVRVWSQASDRWDLKLDLTKRIKEALDDAGVAIPYPQRTVHIVNEAGG